MPHFSLYSRAFWWDFSDTTIRTCTDTSVPEITIVSNREARRNKQPFYRGLKKYRKP